MAKKKTNEAELTDEVPIDGPAELPTPAPDPAPLVDEPDPTEADLDAQIAALQQKKAALAPPPDHTAIHGADSILDPTGDKDYYVWVNAKRFVHVGEYDNQWVYRPD